MMFIWGSTSQSLKIKIILKIELIVCFAANIDKVILQKSPVNVGKKPGQVKQIRIKKGQQLPSQDEIRAEVILKASSRAKKCFGCGESLAGSLMIMKCMEYRPFKDPWDHSYIGGNFSNTYYCFGLKCVQLKHPNTTSDNVALQAGLDPSILKKL